MSRNILIISFVILLAAGSGTGSNVVNNMIESMLDGGEGIYYDTVTGEQISQAKYSGNVLCDNIKKISPYIYVVSMGIGILLLIVIQNSGKIRKIAISGFIVGIPLTWYGVAYFLVSYMVDHFIK